MAGDWIKMRSNLWDDPRVARLCDLTDQGEATVIGGLYWLWAAADQHTESGEMIGLSLRQIDRKTGIQGFGQSLHDIGWIEEIDGGIRIVRFDEHNGASAKRRSMEAKRKAEGRKASASKADTTQTECGRHAELEKEKEKENKTTPCSPPSGTTQNDYPHDFQQAWQAYPRRAGGNPKRKAFQAWRARVKSGASPERILEGVERYAFFIRSTGKENTEFVKQGATFFGPDEHYLDDWAPPEAGNAKREGSGGTRLGVAERIRLANQR